MVKGQRATEQQPNSKQIFAYDQIDYYHNSSIDNKGFSELHKNMNRSTADSIKLMVYCYGIPANEQDTAFLSYLKEMGYTQSQINPVKFASIDTILHEMENSDAAAACIRRYRDILIFRKNGAVVGMAKFCFECPTSRFDGFGRSAVGFADVDHLAQILDIKPIKRG